MLKSIRLSLLISTVLLIFYSCKTIEIGGTLIDNEVETITNPYFNQTGFEYIYGAQIKAYDNSLSGLLVVKKLGNNHKRIALVSDFGNTLFDIEFQDGKSKVHYAIDDLNRKIIVNKFSQYFQLLIHSDYPVIKTYQVVEDKVYLSEFQKKQISLQSNNQGNKLTLKQYNRGDEKVTIHYFGSSIADSIDFVSKELPIEIKLIKR